MSEWFGVLENLEYIVQKMLGIPGAKLVEKGQETKGRKGLQSVRNKFNDSNTS